MTRTDLNDQGKMKKVRPLKKRSSKTLALKSTVLLLSCAVEPLLSKSQASVDNGSSLSGLTNVSVVCPISDDPQSGFSFIQNPVDMYRDSIELTHLRLQVSASIPSNSNAESPALKESPTPRCHHLPQEYGLGCVA